MKRFIPLTIYFLFLALPLEAGQIKLVRTPGYKSPKQVEVTKRLVPAMTNWQKEAAPFARFRFRPTDKDMARINRLRQGQVDTVRVLCLRVEFVEDTTPLTTGNGKMDTFGFLSPDSGLFYDPPHFKLYFERMMEGLRNYYRAQSLGKLYIDFKVMPEGEKEAYQLPREMMFYGDTLSYEGIEFGLVRLMHDALKIADEDPNIRFRDYDEFIIFHAGSGLQSDYAADGRWDSPYDLLAGEIPPGAIEAYLGVPYILVDEGQTRIEQATVLPEMMRQDTLTEKGETNLAGMVGLAGTLAHEFAHLLGAYDLYDVTGVTMGVGAWSLMGYGGWLGDYGAGAPPGVIPGFLDAYNRVQLGFIHPVVVSVPKESIFVYAAAMDTELFAQRPDSLCPTIIKIPVNQNEYFLIENRQTDIRKPDTIIVDVEDGVLIGIESNEYDFFQPGSGILIWHIDEKIIADYGPYNAINIFPEHKGVDLEEGDGVQDFDVPYWKMYNYQYEIYGYKYDAFSKQGYNDRFNANTNPNSDGYTGKTFLAVNLLGVKDTSDRLKDTVIPISVNWELYQPGFPVDQGRNSPFRSSFAADLDLDGTLEIITADSAGQVSVWRADGTGYRYPNGAFVNTNTAIIADVAIGNVAPNPGLEIAVAGVDRRVRIYDAQGQLVKSLITFDRIVAAPTLADLDGDGYKDVIVGSTDLRVYAWNYQGQDLPGFPFFVGSEIRAPVAVTDTILPKIVILTGDHRLLLLNYDGTVVPGFPLSLGNSPFYSWAQPIVADFDRDSMMEIAVVAGGGHNYRVYIVELDGKIVFTSQELIEHPFTGTIACEDINRDGFLDIIAAARHKLFAFNRNATLLTNYPFVYESTYTVQELAGNWIITYDVPFEYRSSPVIADINNDGIRDLIIGSPEYGVLGFDGGSGRLLDYFPLMTTASVRAIPLVIDIDQDGLLEIVAGSDKGIFYVWKIPNSNPQVKWGCAYHDPCHTGLIPLSEIPSLPSPSATLVEGFYVYPNPAGEEVNIRYRLGPGNSKVWLVVLDMSGQPVIKEFEAPAVALIDNEAHVDLRTIAPGLYVVRLRIENGSQNEIRFTKLAIVR
ncbi:MAG: T9SS type A sorting domain-containing protein [candidate division WOR-3 bacterium]